MSSAAPWSKWFLVLFMLCFLTKDLTAKQPAIPPTQINKLSIEQLLHKIQQTVVSDIKAAQELMTVTETQLKHLGSPKQWAKLHNLRAYSYILTRNFDLALQHSLKAQGFAIRSNNQFEQAEALRLEALVYSLTNLADESLAIFSKSLAIFTQLKSDKVWAVLQGISLYYRTQGNYAKYLEYGQLILNHPLTQTEKKYMGTAEYTVGEGLLKLGEYAQARIHLNASIDALESANIAWVSEAYTSLAELELMEGNIQQALNTVLKARAISIESQYYTAQLKADILSAQIHQAAGDPSLAVFTLEQALLSAREHKDLSGELQALKLISQVYESQNNLAAALAKQRAYSQLSDQVAKNKQHAKAEFYRAQLDYEHKNQQIKQLEEQQKFELLQRQQKQRTSQLKDFVLILTSCLLVFLVYFGIRAHRIRQKMERLANDAEQANQAKSSFLAKMSHEIRTPMNAIIGLSQITLKDTLSKKQRENIAMVHASSQTLLTLLNDILDFSKIEARKLELERAPFMLMDSLNRLLDVCQFSAQEKLLTLNINIDSDVPNALIGDALRLEQVLINLTNNAIKFTEKGDIDINVALESQTENRLCLKFTVRDSGVGISSEQSARLFQPFSQTDNSVTRRYGGTGLGLVICKELVELMQGEISVDSQVGIGSSFSFTAMLKENNQAMPTPTVAPQDFSKLNVLIVDDSMSSRTLLVEMLNDMGIIAHQAQGGVEALEVLKQAIDHHNPFDVVLMDWRMPGLDGFESIRIINQVLDDNLPEFILISSYDKAEALSQSRQTPVADILEKPVKQTQLTASLNRLINVIPATESEDKSFEIIKPMQSIGSQHVDILLAEDNLINQRVIQGFLEDFNISIDNVESGLEAIEAVKKKDYDLILMDVQMPEMDGLCATRVIREELRIQTPIIAMTAHSTKQDSDASLAAGMNVHLTKPVDANVLIAQIAHFMEQADVVKG